MRAELKYLLSTDIDEDTYWPDDEEIFGFNLDATIGPKGQDAGDIFTFFVCTPKWITSKSINRHFGDVGIFGRHLIIVVKYDLIAIREMIAKLCASTTGKNWQEVANKLSRYASWEYADYKVNDS